MQPHSPALRQCGCDCRLFAHPWDDPHSSSQLGACLHSVGELNRQTDERAQVSAHAPRCAQPSVHLSEVVAAERGQRCEKTAFNMTLINYMVPSDRKAAPQHTRTHVAHPHAHVHTQCVELASCV